MAYPHNFLRLQVQGLGYGDEMWSWSLNIAKRLSGPDGEDAGAGDIVAPTSVPQGVIDAVQTFHTSTSIAGPAAKLTTIKLNEIGPDGRYVSGDDTVLYEFDSPIPGIAGTYGAPQLALAISLMTAKRRGYAHAGRFYPPYFGVPLQQDGLVSEAVADHFRLGAQALIMALNASSGGTVSIMSSVGAGASNAVTRVRVGRVVDTIRRRRNALNENYLTPVDVAP